MQNARFIDQEGRRLQVIQADACLIQSDDEPAKVVVTKVGVIHVIASEKVRRVRSTRLLTGML
jgi:hypothetical protein